MQECILYKSRKFYGAYLHRNSSCEFSYRRVRPGNEQPARHTRGAPCLARLHLPRIPKRRKKPRAFCKFENFTLQRVAARARSRCSAPDFRRRRRTGGFFSSTTDQAETFPRACRGGAKAGPDSGAGDAGATCCHGGRRLFPAFSTVARPSRSCLSLPPSPASFRAIATPRVV